MRHLNIGDCFIEECVYHKLFHICKVQGKMNASDVLTKHVDRVTLERHAGKTGFTVELIESSALTSRRLRLRN
eukprot:2996933-Amphidinium_carterae.1